MINSVSRNTIHHQSFGAQHPEITKEMLEYYLNRCTPFPEIRKELGITDSKLRHSLVKFGLQVKKIFGINNNEDLILQLYKQNLPIKKITKIVGIEKHYIVNCLKKHNLPTDENLRHIAQIKDTELRKVALKLGTPEETIAKNLK